MNRIIIQGEIKGQPQITYSQNNNEPIARFMVAIKNYKADGSEAGTDFVPCTAFKNAAAFIEKAKEGDNVVCSGSIQTGSYTDRSGAKVYTTDVLVAKVTAGAGGYQNVVNMTGRLTRDPYVTNGQVATAKYTLAVDRRFKAANQPEADFISCVSFEKTAEFAEKYLKQGRKIGVEGYFHTGSYTNKDGQTVYTRDVVVNNVDFCDSKPNGAGAGNAAPVNTGMGGFSPAAPGDFGFINIPEGIDEELPFM